MNRVQRLALPMCLFLVAAVAVSVGELRADEKCCPNEEVDHDEKNRCTYPPGTQPAKIGCDMYTHSGDTSYCPSIKEPLLQWPDLSKTKYLKGSHRHLAFPNSGLSGMLPELEDCTTYSRCKHNPDFAFCEFDKHVDTFQPHWKTRSCAADIPECKPDKTPKGSE